MMEENFIVADPFPSFITDTTTQLHCPLTIGNHCDMDFITQKKERQREPSEKSVCARVKSIAAKLVQ